MPGMFDDLIPTQTAAAPSGGGMFDDLVPAGSSGDERGDLSWSDVPAKAISNIPQSTINFVHALAQPIVHPVDTVKGLASITGGLAEKAAPYAGGSQLIQGVAAGSKYLGGNEASADAAGQFFKDRYGGVENIKRTLATDPIGSLADASAVLTGGGSAAARLPGIAGRVGEIANTVGRAADPVTWAMAPVKAAPHIIGGFTGTGEAPINAAARAGFEGGQAGQTFRQNMRGQAPLEDAVLEARGAVDQMRRERGDAYRRGMTTVGHDKTILSWNDVDRALVDMDNVATFKGQSLSPSTEKVRNTIRDTIDQWKNLHASEFWTPEGFDALKRKIGDIRDSTPFGTPERAVASQAYSAVRNTIVKQVPEYARVMRGYEQASGLVKEIEQVLTGRPGANIESNLRKLQSVMRNNVNTSFGRREELAKFLVNSGAPHLMEALAGQALSSWLPRGLNRSVAAHTAAQSAGLLGAGVKAGAGAMAATLPVTSPRLMGEAAYKLGQLARPARPFRNLPARPLLRGAFQAGRNQYASGGTVQDAETKRVGDSLGGRYTRRKYKPSNYENTAPESTNVEDRRGEKHSALDSLGNFFMSDPTIRAARHWWTGPHYRMDELYTPIESDRMAVDLGANDIGGLRGLSAREQAQFDRGETPGSLPFEIDMKKVEFPRTRQRAE